MITVKIRQSKGVLIRFGSQIFVIFATFFRETENRFPNKKETDILPLVIIEAIQVYGFTGIGLALSGENNVYYQRCITISWGI